MPIFMYFTIKQKILDYTEHELPSEKKMAPENTVASKVNTMNYSLLVPKNTSDFNCNTML